MNSYRSELLARRHYQNKNINKTMSSDNQHSWDQLASSPMQQQRFRSFVLC